MILKWSIENSNGSLSTSAAPNFIIGGNDKQMISLKFEKRRISTNNLERIQFSAVDMSSQTELSINSLRLFEMNTTGLQIDPIDLFIKRPSKLPTVMFLL